MSTQTPNLNLDLREASDIFNPLSTNSNFETLDSVITEIRKKGGVPTYTTTASANLLKLSENPVPNETLFKFVAAGDANTWSYQETVNNIVALDGTQKTVKSGEMYVAWVNAANAMVVIAWPDVVNAQTFDGKAPAEWASKAQLDAVNQTAANATTTAQAAVTVANNALDVANKAGLTLTPVWENTNGTLDNHVQFTINNVNFNWGDMFAIIYRDAGAYATQKIQFVRADQSGSVWLMGLTMYAGNLKVTVRSLLFAGDKTTITVGECRTANAFSSATQVSTDQYNITIDGVYKVKGITI